MLSSITRERVKYGSCLIGFVMGSLLLVFMARDFLKSQNMMADRRRKLTKNTINQVRRQNTSRRLAQSGSRFQPATQRRLR